MRIKRKTTEDIKQYKIVFAGQTVIFGLRCSARATRTRLIIAAGSGLTVVIPKGCDVNKTVEFIKEKEKWILHNLAKLNADKTARPPQHIQDGDIVFYLGKKLTVVRKTISHRKGVIRLSDDSLTVNLSMFSEDGVNALLEGLYRRQAAKLMQEKTAQWGKQMDVKPSGITIRGQKTRWGSCSRKGRLNFNWKLMMAPEPVIDYLVIHELAHLKEMNHSKKFWDVVNKHCPEWREQRKWLRQHDRQLSAGLAASCQ
ncbi:M48 family metallopeptidase [Chloroflexota bacterium]